MLSVLRYAVLPLSILSNTVYIMVNNGSTSPLFLDLDPCIEVACYYHSHCKAFAPQDARCVCAESCPSYKEPVCSSNGTTYENKCLFEQEMCLLRLNFTLQHPGSCEGEHSVPKRNTKSTKSFQRFLLHAGILYRK